MHLSIMEATVPFVVPFAIPTEGLGIVETLEEHFEIMNPEVDTPEDYVGPLTGMDVCHKTLALFLQNYDSVKANYLVCGFKNGFRIGFQGDRHFRVSPNLKSASEFPEIVEEKLAKEISQGRIAGPFHNLV